MSPGIHGELIELAETAEEAVACLKAVPEDVKGAAEILMAVATQHELLESEGAARKVAEKCPEGR